ncbi:MAG: hypothetical protein Fur0037_17080 [Planctomycetota bacterium]
MTPAPIALSALLLFAAPQDPPVVVAHYRLGDQVRAIDMDEIALEMAFHLVRKQEGREAVRHLCDTRLVTEAARRLLVLPDSREVEAFRAKLAALVPAGPDGSEQRRTIARLPSEELASSMAFDRLVRKALEMPPDEPVSSDMRKLWLAEERERHQIVDDPDALPVGSALRIDGVDVPMLLLGRLLAFKATAEQIEGYVRQIVLLRSLEAMAAERGIRVGREDLEAELAERAREVEADPRYRGISFAELLKSQGFTEESLLRSNVFRASVLQRKLAEVVHPRSEFLAALAADRAAILERYGARRRIRGIFLRAMEHPNELIPRTFEQAASKLEELAGKANTVPFERLAMVESEHGESKTRGGDLGFVARREPGFPEPLLAAAFALQPETISSPIRCGDGVWIVEVVEAEPDPPDDVILRRWRDKSIEEQMRSMLERAAIRLEPPYGPGADQGTKAK